MPAPSSTLPLRTPLGPHANRRGRSVIFKPADGKENIPPPPGSSSAVIVTTITTAQPATAATDIIQTGETPTTRELPPWRLPGAFDADDDEDQKQATRTNEEKIKNAEDTNYEATANGNDYSGNEEHGAATSTASAMAALQSINHNADEAKKEEDVKRDASIEYAALGGSPRASPATGANLSKDKKIGCGDESHRSPLDRLEAFATDVVATASTDANCSSVSGEDKEDVNVLDEDLAPLSPFEWIPPHARVSENYELVDYGDEFHDLVQ